MPVEWGAGAVLTVATFFVHPVSYVLTTPLWYDEKWVAISTRASLGQLRLVTLSTPIGWTLLLRLVPVHGTQALRMVPLLFAAGAVAVAFLLGRELRLLPLLTAVFLAAAVLLVPSMLVRDELKPYTADVFFTLLLLLLLARLETRWTRGRLAAIASTGTIATLFSHASAFSAIAVMGALLLTTLATRRWNNMKEIAAGSVAMGAGMGVVYVVFDLSQRTPALRNYWHGFYFPLDHPGRAFGFVHHGFARMVPYLGSHNTVIPVLLFFAGVATLVSVRRYASAVAVPMLVVIVLIASGRRVYPVFTVRTDTFWIVSMAVLMALGAIGLVRLAARVHWLLAGALAATIAILWIDAVRPYIRTSPVPFYFDTKLAVRYIDAHRRPGDVILVSHFGAFGFAYYARAHPGFRSASTTRWAEGFTPTYPHDPSIVIAPLPATPGTVDTAVRTAQRRASAPGSHRVWMLLDEEDPAEAPEWNAELDRLGPRPVANYLFNNREGLFLWQTAKP